MGVKVIKSAPWTKRNGSAKGDLLGKDIMDIIANEIEFCELTDFPYSDKTQMSSINYRIKRIFESEFRRRIGKYKKLHMPFTLTRVKDKDGTCHYYGTFSVASWKRQIEEAKQEE